MHGDQYYIEIFQSMFFGLHRKLKIFLKNYEHPALVFEICIHLLYSLAFIQQTEAETEKKSRNIHSVLRTICEDGYRCKIKILKKIYQSINPISYRYWNEKRD